MLVAAHAWYGDVIGGSFRLASEFAQSLSEDGWRVIYLCCAADGESSRPARETIRGVDVWRYPAMRGRGWRGGWGAKWGGGRLRYHLRQTARLAREIVREQPIDVLSAHSPLQGWGAAKVLRPRGTFINYTVHSPFDDEMRANRRDIPEGQSRVDARFPGPAGSPPRLRGGDRSSGMLRGLSVRAAAGAACWIDRRNLRVADRIQTDSVYTMDVLARRHGEWVRRKGTVAPGWVDTQRFRPVEDRRAVRRELGGVWDTDVPVLFTLRRLEPRMGLETLVDAAGRLRREGREFRVLIGGGGSLAGVLRDRVGRQGLEECVHLLGRAAEEDLPRMYSASDCFVLPTRALECFGLIVLEAFAAGTPVIASRAGAIPEIAGRQGEEFLFEPGDAGGLAARLRRLLDGALAPAIDLRQTACEYDRRKVMPLWQQLVIPEACPA